MIPKEFRSVAATIAMRKLSLFVALLPLLFFVACGTGGNGTIGIPVGSGNFSNSSLSGQYTYQVSGADYTGSIFYREAGSFNADGNGHLTGGIDDLANSFLCSGGFCEDSLTGSYSINKDGIGSLTLNFSGSVTDFFITMVSSNKLYLMPVDNGNGFPLSGAGIAEKQTASAFSSIPSGTFVFQTHNSSDINGAYGTVGAVTVSGGGVSGTADVLRGGVHSSGQSVTGFLDLPDSNGRGTGAFIDPINGTSDFVYYVVDANNFRIFSNDSGVLGGGRGEKQSGGPFSTASLSGSYAFGSRGEDSFFSGGVSTVGVFTADGAGNISAGNYDTSLDGSVTSNLTFTGTYTLNAAGRANVTLSQGGTVNQIFWLVSPTRAFSLTNDPNKVEDGTMDKQTVSPFSAATMNGQFGLVMDGFDANTQLFDRIGTLKWDGASVLTINDIFNEGGFLGNSGIVNGTFAVGANGRATGTVGSSNLTFYLVSGSDAYVLQTDPSTGLIGAMSKQPQ